jgi:hypothetical protein
MMRWVALAFLMGCEYTTVLNETVYVEGDGGMTDALGKKNGWQQNGLITRARPDQGISLQAEFEDDPGYYTLQFGVNPPGGSIDAVAEIEWSVEGSTISRFISVGVGTTISGPGQAVRARLFDRSTSPVFFTYPGSIQLTRGTRPNVNQPPTLIQFPEAKLIPAFSGISIDIPRKVGVISVEVTAYPQIFPAAPVTPNLVITFFNGSGVNKVYLIGEPGNFVPVPPNSTKMIIDNADPLLDLYVQVTWGIDG